MFFEGGKLVVRQKKDWAETFTDFETANQYELVTPDGQTVGRVAEQAGGCMSMLLRNQLKSARPLHLEVFDAAGNQALVIHRPFSLFLSRMVVKRPDGTVIGTVKKQFSLIRASYGLLDAGGQAFGQVTGKLLSRRKFPLYRSGTEVGAISKEFQGFSELFTDADTFVVDLGGGEFDDDQQQVVLATALAVDLDLFEN